MKESSAKKAKTFQTLFVEILTLYMIPPRKINITQMACYSKHSEQADCQKFNRRKKSCIDRFLLNLSLARRIQDMSGLLAIAITSCYIIKAKKRLLISDCFGLGYVGGSETRTWNQEYRLAWCCMTVRFRRELRAKDENKTFVEYYISFLKWYSKNTVFHYQYSGDRRFLLHIYGL